MDKDRIAAAFARAAQSYEREALAQRVIVERLMSLVPRGHYRRVLEIGCGTGLLTRRIEETFAPREFFINDLCRDMAAACPVNSVFLSGDAEVLEFPGRFDAIFSASAMQWFRDPAAFIGRAAGLLNPGGILALSTFAPENLPELNSLTGNGLQTPSLEALNEMLAPFFDLLTLEGESIALTFPDPPSVLRHLRETGVNGLAEAGWQPTRLRALCRDYQARFSVPGGVRLTYAPIYLIARR